MGRKPCCLKEGMNRGAWTASEDKVLVDYINAHGEGKWRNIPNQSGLKRCGKSCRLRWLNYLRPDIKRGNITSDEDDLIIRLHKLLGNRWSLIAGRLPGRTDNEIKNYWNTNLSKRASDKLQQSPNSISGIIHAKAVRFIERIPQLENNIIRDHSDGTQDLKHADSVLERKEFAQVMTTEFNLEDTSFSEFFGDDFDQCDMSTMVEGDDTSVNWCKTELPTFLGEAFLSLEKWSGDLDCGQVNTNLDFESFGVLEAEVGWI